MKELGKLWMTLGVAMLGGCALIYNYGDYSDTAGSGGENAGGSTSSGMAGSTSSGMGGLGGSTSSGMGGIAGSSTTSGGGGPPGGGCLVDEQCPPTGSPCSLSSCSLGLCGSKPVNGNTPLYAQVVGDCKRRICDGLGNDVTVNDDNDTPDDNNECTTDTCSAGNPFHAFVAAGAPCGQGLMCSNVGTCTGCSTDGQCIPPNGSSNPCKQSSCINNQCAMFDAPNGTNCGDFCQDHYFAMESCMDGFCQIGSGMACLNGTLCINSTSCNNFPNCGPGCTAGYFCNGNSQCQKCTTCTEWALNPTDTPNPGFCSGSQNLAQDLKNCACNGICMQDCQDTILCSPAGPLDLACAACVATNCNDKLLNCQNDRPAPAVPSP